MRKPVNGVARRWSTRVLGVLAMGIVVWHLLAFVIYFTMPTANADGDPDRSAKLPAHMFVAGFFGTDVEGQALPLKLEPIAWNEERHARLEGVKTDAETGEVRVHLRLRLGVETPLVKLRLDQVVWHKGDSPNVVLRFGDREVTTMFVGEGYDYWKFLTFRSSERHEFRPKEITYRDDFGVTLPEVLASSHTSATITAPDTPAWNQAMTVG